MTGRVVGAWHLAVHGVGPDVEGLEFGTGGTELG
jgi:hypothetical protein